jgi:hypothetical protein
MIFSSDNPPVDLEYVLAAQSDVERPSEKASIGIQPSGKPSSRFESALNE